MEEADLGELDRRLFQANAVTSTNAQWRVGHKHLEALATLKGWSWPYPSRDNPRKGLVQLLQFVDYLGYTLGKPPGTVKQYFSGAKMYQLKSLQFAVQGLTDPGPWSPEKSYHPLVSLALSNIPEQDTIEGFAIPSN